MGLAIIKKKMGWGRGEHDLEFRLKNSGYVGSLLGEDCFLDYII